MPDKRTIGVVTGSRADYGIFRPVLQAIEQSEGLKLRVFVTGSHLMSKYGLTAKAIEDDGFEISACVECSPQSDTPEGFVRAVGEELCTFAQVFTRMPPDILLVLGDRFEMHGAVCSAVPFLIPVAHIHGGEVTEGAIDELFRHSITKMSHIHFVATEEYRRRVIQMGEEPWRVTVSGAPGLENINHVQFMSLDELADDLKMNFETPPLMVTFHPATMEHHKAGQQAKELFAALAEVKGPIVITSPNGDIGSDDILPEIHAFVEQRPDCCFVENLGTKRYFSLMKHSLAMVGNSSSGIIEAGSFELPVVNVGNRQQGRTRGINTIDVRCRKDAILQGLTHALSGKFRESLHGMTNPYGDGNAAARIVDALENVTLDQKLKQKRFYDIPFELPQ